MNPVYIILGIFGMVTLASFVYAILKIKKGFNTSSDSKTQSGAEREMRELCKNLTGEELYKKAYEYVDKDGEVTKYDSWKTFMSASASKGYIPAIREWGIYNKYKNSRIAEEMLTRAAEAGDAKATEELYKMYYYGTSGTPKISKDVEKALQIITPFADKGNAVAIRLLGKYYYYDKDDNDKALELYLKAADGGDAEAMTEAAEIYFYRDDYEEYKRLLLKAAEQNYADAESKLGYYYQNLDDFEPAEPDLPQALQWYKRASEHGDNTATCDVGEMYLNGEGTVKDEYEAFNWFKKAMDAGSVYGTYLYGRCLMNGTGVAQDKKKGIKLYTEAAEYDEDAQCALGICYLEGDGVEKDLKKAVFYLEKAVSDKYVKNEEAEAKLEELRASGIIK